MANLDKNILITPNVGANGDPTIVFSAANTTSNAANITLRAYPTSNGTLSFEGSAGQLFSITNNLTGTLFSVNDISGIPSIEVLDTGRINLAQYNGNVVIGANTSANASTSNTTGELVVFGGVGVTGNIYVGGTSAGSNGIYTDILRYAANGLPWVMGGGGPGSSGNVSASGYTANTIITANSGGFLGSSGSFFVASNNAIVVPNVVITQAATASFPLSFGSSIGNKIALYEGTFPSNGTGYGFGIQANKLQIFHGSQTDHTSIGHGSSSNFTESFRIASVASAVNYLQVIGATTANTPILSAQGSDANVSIQLLPKGVGSVLINQSYNQGTGILQANGSFSVAGNTTSQNLHVIGNNNAFTWSQDFTNVAWSKGDVTAATTAATLAPNGTTTAIKIIELATNAQHLITQIWPLTPVIGTPYTISVYAKAAERTFIWLTTFSQDYVVFNLSTGAITGSTALSPAYSVSVGNGWYRCVATFYKTTTNPSFYVGLSTGGGSGYLGDGTSGAYLWGAQIEAGAFASPYTPTTTAAITNTNNLYVPSGNVYVGNTSSYSTTNNAINVIGSIGTANSIYVGNRVGFANSNNISVIYQSYNASTNSLDVVFG